MNPAAILSILVETQGAGVASGELRKLDKSARTASGGLDSAHSSASKSGKAMATFAPIAKTAGLVLGGALAVGAKAGFEELKDGQKVAEQTNSVLKSTGGVAKISASQVSDLATAISKKSGIDDEAIQSAENLLLTFKNVRNETGKGNDIFSKATQTIADMSTALGQDLKSSSIQVGKALNDPLKGITALQRVGVTFTKGQKDQIKTLVESGHTLDAQKIILKELNSEFGGSATAAGKTFQGQINKLQNAFEDVAASVVTMLLPALQTLATVLTDLVGYFQKHTTQAKILGVVMAALAVAMVSVSVATKAMAAGTAIATAAQWALNAAMSANPIALIVIALAALAAGLVVAYQKIGPFHDAVDAVFGALKDAFGWAKDHWPLLLAILTGPFGLAVLAISKNVDAIVDFFKALPGRVVAAIKAGAGSILDAGKWIVNRVVDGVTSMASAIGGAAGWVRNRVADGIRSSADAIVAAGSWITNRVADGISTLTDALAAVGGWIRNRVSEAIRGSADSLIAVGTWITNRVADGITTITDALSNVGGWLKNRVVAVVHDAVDGFTSLGGWLVGRIVDGIQGAGAAIKDAAKWLKDKIVDAIKDFFGIHSPSTVMMELGGHMVTGLIKGLDPGPVVKHLISKFGGIPALAGNVLGGALGAVGNAVGGAVKGGGSQSTDGHPGNVLGALLPLIGLGHTDGLVVTSTTDGRHVNGSNHYTGHAVDMAGSAGAMMKFAQQLLGMAPSLRELFYDPLGVYVKNGSIIKGAIGGHGDHVHVAMAKGGLVNGLTYAMLGEKPGLREAVLPLNNQVYAELGAGIASASGGGQIVIVEHHYHGPVVQDRDFLAYLRKADQQHAHRNGKSAFAGG